MYFVKIHIQTGVIDGYLEEEGLKLLHSAHEDKSDRMCVIRLKEDDSFHSEQTNVYLFPNQIIAIESKPVA